MKFIHFIFLVFYSCPLKAVVQEVSSNSQFEVNATLYANDVALIKEKRKTFLKTGTNKLLIKGVPFSILMDSFIFQLLTPDPSIKVLEYSFQSPDITRDKLFEHSIGERVTIMSDPSSPTPQSGTLISLDGEDAFVDSQGTIFAVKKSRIAFPHLPYTLVAEPMIILKLMNYTEGEYFFEVGYLAKGISWDAGYTIILSENEQRLNLNSWLNIHNQSGMDITKGHFRITQENELFYDLERPISLPHQSTKNISWFSAQDLKPTQSYRIYPEDDITVDEEGLVMKPVVETWLSVKNDLSQGLGIFLPEGIIQVFRRNKDGSLLYVGENKTSLTPINQELSLRVGSTQDIKAEMRQTDYRKLGNQVVESGYRLDLKNTTKSPKQVTVFQNVPGEWIVLRETHAHEVVDKRLKWTLDIGAEEEISLRYRIRMNVK